MDEIPVSGPSFAKLNRKRLRWGSLLDIVDLQAAIHGFIKEHNRTAKAFRLDRQF